MMWTMLRRAATWARVPALALLATGSLASCGVLDVPDDPTAVDEADVNDAAGAQLLRRDALRQLSGAVAEGALLSGILADEFTLDVTGGSLASLDRRDSELYEQASPNGDAVYNNWHELRRAASVALPKLATYATPDVRGAHLTQVFALRGFAALRLAEYVCPGFPLHELVDYQVVVGPALSTEQALERALVDFDSALGVATDSLRYVHLARLGRARTLLNLGRATDAAAAVTDVPTAYVYVAEYSEATGQRNPLFPHGMYPGGWGGATTNRTVADQEGGTGLDFVAAADPRVPTTFLRVAQDGVTPMYGVGKYPAIDTPILLASGVEARLIEAEAALEGTGDWLGMLNALRTDGTQAPDGTWNPGTGGVAGLAPLTDPGSAAARVDLVFRERAFWLFATGSRLGDLRRLIRHYGRSSESVFPTGLHRLGAMYGTATSIPFGPGRETPFNPAVTGCTSR